MKTTLTEFQRNFRKAREAADRGDPVIVKGESGEYLFERRSAPTEHPFVGLEGVFGAVNLPRDKVSLREKNRRRLGAATLHVGGRARCAVSRGGTAKSGQTPGREGRNQGVHPQTTRPRLTRAV